MEQFNILMKWQMIEQKEFEKLSWEDTVEKIVNLPEEDQLEGLMDLAVWLRDQRQQWKKRYHKEVEEKDNCLRCIESLSEDNKRLEKEVDEWRDRIHQEKVRQQNVVDIRVRDATEWTKRVYEDKIADVKKKFRHMKRVEVGVLSICCVILCVLVLCRQGKTFSNAHLFVDRTVMVASVIKGIFEFR